MTLEGSKVYERRQITWWNCHNYEQSDFICILPMFTPRRNLKYAYRKMLLYKILLSSRLWNPDSGPKFWVVRAAPRSLLIALLTRFFWSLERNLRGSTGLCGFCGFNKWNFETSKSTFDIQFIIFRFWNEGLGERSSSSFTYTLSLQLDSHGFFAIS